MLIPMGFLAASGAAAGSYELIATMGGGGTFDAIPQTYKHLQIRYVGKSDKNGTDDLLRIRLNGDTNANNATHGMRGLNGAVSATGFGDVTFIGGGVGFFYITGNTTANNYGAGIIDFVDYSSTSKFKTVKAITGWNNTSGGVSFNSGLWRSTSAITSIAITPQGGNGISGRFSLYGIKG